MCCTTNSFWKNRHTWDDYKTDMMYNGAALVRFLSRPWKIIKQMRCTTFLSQKTRRLQRGYKTGVVYNNNVLKNTLTFEDRKNTIKQIWCKT